MIIILVNIPEAFSFLLTVFHLKSDFTRKCTPKNYLGMGRMLSLSVNRFCKLSVTRAPLTMTLKVKGTLLLVMLGQPA